ncbi:41614_t:CDS:2 [Gigaspora margarita]|uniref:41614_t:CDS:1 n=1 Tax=Gigaspora margarita TaxID=4874 RepID=A0ABN7V205_GIGMA|nr:41614_t:CDS:2 [Gigaspora margarita]
MDTSLNFNTLKRPKQLDNQASATLALSTLASSRLASSTSSSSATTLSKTAMSQNRKKKKKGSQVIVLKEPQVIIESSPPLTTFKKTTATKISNTVDPRIINKVLNVMQNNSVQLVQLSRDHARLKFLIREQQMQLEEILKKFEIIDEFDNEQLKEMLESDEECAEQLQKLNDKVKPFSEKDTKKQMREWKKNSKKAYKDLYNPSDLDNPNSNIFLSLIIKYVFVSDEEYTQANAIWTQAYLSPKIDADVIDVWIQKLNIEGDKDVYILSINDFTNLFELEVQNTVLQKSSASFSAILEAAIQENYEVSSGDSSENDRSSDSNYEE